MDAARPPTSTTAAMTTPMRRRLRVEGITSNLYAPGAEPTLHLGLNSLQLLFRSCLEAHDEHGLSVRRSDEPPAIAEEDSSAVDRDDFVFGAEVFRGFFDNAELLVVGTVNPDFRGRNEAGNVSQQIPHAFPRIGHDAKQPRRSVERVVESIKSLGEEHVPGHLARNRRSGLVHLLLDERVSRLPHDGDSACVLDGFRQCLGCLHVENDYLALPRARQHVARIHDQDVVPPNYLAGVVDHTDAVRVAIERNADVGVVLFHGGDEILDVFRDSRIRVVIRKRAVALAEQKARLDAELRKELWRNKGARSVATIENDHQVAREFPDVCRNVVDVAVDDLLVAKRALPAWEFARDSELIEVLYISAVNGAGCETKLESVVLGRIVGAGDLDSADHIQIVLGPVGERGRNDSDVHHVDAACEQPRHQRSMQSFSAWPVIAPDGERTLHALFGQERGVRASDCRGDFFGEILSGDAADVVLAKDRARHCHWSYRDRSATSLLTAGVLRCVRETRASGNNPKIRMTAAEPQITARVQSPVRSGRTAELARGFMNITITTYR